MTSVRDAFFNRIYKMVQQGDDIVIITPDLGAPSLDDFRKYYPERFISVGIAEQNLISVAAGLVLSGKKVIAYGLNPFPITRAYDQIRSLLAEMGIPIMLCALNAGLCAAECGYTHMPVEDIGMMRMLSNIQIINPSDETISEIIASEAARTSHTRYIRFDKAIRGRIYNESEIDLNRGFTVYGESGEVCVITYGCYVKDIRKLVDEYVAKGKMIQVIDLYSLPVDETQFISCLTKNIKILTVEESLKSAGIGSYVLEILSEHQIFLPVKRLGLSFDNGYYNVFTNREFIQQDQKLDISSIAKNIDELFENED